MDEVYVELDEVKAELEKLRADYKSKSELSDNLRKAYNEQLNKAQEASLKIEKQAREINESAEKISAAQQMCEDLKYILKDKESVLQHLRAANEKLRIDSDEKCRKLEETNRVLALALDEANEKKMEEEQEIQAYKEEIRGLQGRLSDSQKKCLEAERKANASKELRERDVMILRVEEENRKVLDELKWKKEQFQHLEEAHEKLRDEFKETQKEWERERSSLLDEICSLQTSLDSQTRVSDDFQKRLQLCNQALAHEESRRKRLEVQVSEFLTGAFSENEDARSQLECLTAERDKELASLRQSLSSKAALHKEMEYQSGKLQQENEELRMSLKELQEAQIQSAPDSPSLAKLRNKLRRVEQMHKDSLADHRAKEAERSSQLENMTGDLNYCKSELESKDAAINGLRIELEQMQRAKEYECSSQLERMRAELTICQSDLVSKDAALKDLNMEMEQMRGCTTNGVEDAEWSSQLQKMDSDAKSYISEVERKDATITELKMEMEQMHRGCTTFRANESEWSSQLEKLAGDVKSYISKIESKDATITELKMEMEQMHRECTTFRAKESEWSLQLEKLAGDVKSYISKIESKDATITELKMEMEQMHRECTTFRAKESEWSLQLEKLAGDVKSYISKIESKDATIIELKMEMEQMHRECTTFRAKESEWSLQLEKLAGDVKSYISKIESKDATIIELKMDMECATYRTNETEWRSQIEKMTSDVKNYISELKKKDATMNQLKMEMEQRHRDCATYRTNETEWRSQIEKMTSDVKNYISELKKKDATMNQLKMEMEQRHRDCATYRTKETEWSSQLDKMTCDMKSELEKKNATIINQLKMEIDEMHGDCSAYQAKETEWSSQLDKMTGELVCKDAVIYELKMELESCHSLSVQLKLQNEELSVMLLVLKQEMSEAQLKIANEKSEMVLFEKEKEEYISQLRHQLEMKNADLVMAQKCIEEEREKAAFLNKRIDALDFIEMEQLQTQKELVRYKGMVEDSSEQQHRLKQQVLQIESVLERERRELDDALGRANTELAEKISVVSEIEIELHIWKSITENLRIDLEASLGMRKELEASLIAEVDIGETIKQENKGLLRILEEKEKTVENIHEQIGLMEQKLKFIDAEHAASAKREAEMSLEVGRLEQELLMRDLTGIMLAEIGAERSEQEKQKLIQLVDEKYQRLNHLMQRVESLEHKFSCSLVSLSSELTEKQAEINLIQEAWEKNSCAGLENEEKKFEIAQFEEEICTLQTQLELQQKSLCDSQQGALEVEAELETKEMEIKKLKDQMMLKLRSSDALIEELKSERRNLLEDFIQLSSESINEFSSKNQQLAGMLEEMVLSFDNQGPEIDMAWNDELADSEKENVSTPTSTKKHEPISDMRSPFRNLNT